MKNQSPLLSTYSAGILQSKAYRSLTNFMNDYLQPHGLSLSEWKLLGLLDEHKHLAPSEIAETIGIKLPVATRLLGQMDGKGLLSRASARSDKRMVKVTITPKGKKLAKDLEASLRQAMGEFLGDINRQDLNTYLKVLDKLAAKL